MLSPFSYTAKKYAFQVLQERYQRNLPILERLCHYLATEGDTQDFCKLLMECYEAGYLRAVEQYRTQLEQLGYKVVVGPKI